eukprot:gene27783-30801_t
MHIAHLNHTRITYRGRPSRGKSDPFAHRDLARVMRNKLTLRAFDDDGKKRETAAGDDAAARSNFIARVAVTGAAGQIGYSLLFRIANGDLLGKDQPVILQLLESPDEKAQKALKGVIMEIDDCAFPLLAGVTAHSD